MEEKQWFNLMRTALVGQDFSEMVGTFHEVKVDDRLRLVREPDNPHDSHAVRVEWRSAEGVVRKAGYVSRSVNMTLARLMDAGYAVRARVREVTPDGRNLWMDIQMEAKGKV